MRIRSAESGDIPGMMELERQSPSAAHWSRLQYQNLFANAFPRPQSARIAFIVENDVPNPESTSSEASEILAFLVAHRIDQEWELENIVVAETARRRGVATSLMRAFLIGVQRERGGVFLEVRKSNQSARGLYRKLGFTEVGLREGYYANPTEEAVLYRLTAP